MAVGVLVVDGIILVVIATAESTVIMVDGTIAVGLPLLPLPTRPNRPRLQLNLLSRLSPTKAMAAAAAAMSSTVGTVVTTTVVIMIVMVVMVTRMEPRAAATAAMTMRAAMARDRATNRDAITMTAMVNRVSRISSNPIVTIGTMEEKVKAKVNVVVVAAVADMVVGAGVTRSLLLPLLPPLLNNLSCLPQRTFHCQWLPCSPRIPLRIHLSPLSRLTPTSLSIR